jgi:uncharacterized protein YueI
MNPAEILRKIQTISGTNDKVDFLKKYDNDIIRNVVKYAVDPYITYGVKQYSFAEPCGHDDFDHELRSLDFLVTKLSERAFTGKAAQDAIRTASKKLNADQQYVLGCILDKDLKCGISVSNANKAFPDLIPTFKIQKANKVDYAKVVYPCLAEIKENGRGNVAVVNFDVVTHYSTNGIVNENMSHFDADLLGIANGMPMVFLGEVRGRIGKGVDHYKASQGLGAKNADMSDKVFIIWDMLLLGEWKRQRCTRPQKQRSGQLKAAIRNWIIDSDKDEYTVRLVKQKIVHNKKDLEQYYVDMVNKGYEGLIVKNLEAQYEFKRSNNWMKIKEQHDIDLKIVSVKEGKGKLAGMLGSVTVKNGKVKVDCPIGAGISHDEAKKMWKAYKKDEKTLIGKIAEISFQNETPDGSLFLPKFVRIHPEKN